MRIDTYTPIKNIFLNPLTAQKGCDDKFSDIVSILELQGMPSQDEVRPNHAFGFNAIGLFGIGFAVQSGAEITTALTSIVAAPSAAPVLVEARPNANQVYFKAISKGMLVGGDLTAPESKQASVGAISFDNVVKSDGANNLKLSNKNIDYLYDVRLASGASRITVGINYISEVDTQNKNYRGPAYFFKNGVDQKLSNLKAVETHEDFRAFVLNRAMREPSKFFREVSTYSSQVSVTVSNVNGSLYIAASSTKISGACLSKLRVLVDEIAYDYGAQVGEFFLNGVSINKNSKLTQGGYSWQFQR